MRLLYKKDPPQASANPENDVISKWDLILATLKSQRKGSTVGLLKSCHTEFKNDSLILGFQSDVLKTMMERTENLSSLKQAMQEILGRDINIQCTVTNGKAKKSAAEVGVDHDGLVGNALNQGGQIVHRD